MRSRGWYRRCYIFSHHLSFHCSFLHRRMPFHTTIPKRIQTMWVQYRLLPLPRLPALPPHPIHFTYHPSPATPPHPTQPFPWPPQRCCPVLQSQASGLSVCVSEVALLYGELMWQSRGRPTCMWQRLQLSSPSLTSWVFSLPTDPNFVHCGSDLQGVFSLWRPSRHLTQKLESWCTFHTPGHHLCYVFHTKSYEWWSEKNLHAG